MKLDLSKLQNVRHLSGGKTTARCPACAAGGGDTKGDHLVIFANGKFGCVKYPQDKAHNKAILKVAGSNGRGGGTVCRLSVTPMRVDESKVLMQVGRLGRPKPSPGQTDDHLTPPQAEAPNLPEVAEGRPERPASKSPPSLAALDGNHPPEIAMANLREFLDLPDLAA